MVVDVWMQHPTPGFLEHDMFESLRRWTGAQWPREQMAIERTVAATDDAGVDFGLLSAWHAPEGVLIGNDQVAAWVGAHPDRFAGVAAVDLDRPMEAVRELRRCVTELGFKGLVGRGLYEYTVLATFGGSGSWLSPLYYMTLLVHVPITDRLLRER